MMLLGFDLTLVITGLLSLLSLVELGLTGHVASHFHRWFTAPSISFLIFCSVWSLLVLAYLALAPRFAPQLIFHQFVPAAVLAVTTLFWFAGAIAAADHLGVPNCRGSSLCRTWQAAVVFAFFIWILFTGLTVFEGLALRKSHANRDEENQGSKLQAQPPAAPLPTA